MGATTNMILFITRDNITFGNLTATNISKKLKLGLKNTIIDKKLTCASESSTLTNEIERN